MKFLALTFTTAALLLGCNPSPTPNPVESPSNPPTSPKVVHNHFSNL